MPWQLAQVSEIHEQLWNVYTEEKIMDIKKRHLFYDT